jgi:hypothetical protein
VAVLDIRELSDAEAADADGLDSIALLFNWASVVTMIATVVAWCFWKHRCHRNLSALGAVNLQFTPRSAIGFYFLPIFQLFKPYQAMREIAWASNPHSGPAIDCRFHHISTSFLLVAWWVFFFLVSTTDRIAASKTPVDDSSDLSAYKAYYYSSIAALVVFLMATMLAAAVVHRIVRRQERRAALVCCPTSPLNERPEIVEAGVGG